MSAADPSAPSRTDRAVARVILAACQHARAVLAGYALLAGLAIWAIVTGLAVDTDSSRMVDTTLPFQQREAALDAAFPRLADTIAVVVRGGNPDAVDTILEALAEALADDPTVSDIFAPSIDPVFRGHGPLYLPPDALRDQVTRLQQTAPLIATLAAQPDLPTLFTALGSFEAQGGGAALDPIYGALSETIEARLAGEPAALAWSALGETSGLTQRVLDLRPIPDFTALQPVEGTIAAIDRAIADLDPALSALVEIGVTGDPALRDEELDSVSQGIGLSLMASMAMVAVLLLLAYGSPARAAATLAALILSLILATGFAALAFEALNLVSVAFVVLLVGLGLDFTIHALLHIDARAGPGARAPQIARMGAEIGGALVLGAGTTALAFLAFVPTDFDGMAQLGVLGAVGVWIALIVSLTFVPALVMVWPRLARGRPVPAPEAPSPRRPWAAWGLLGLLILLVPVALGLGREVRFDADPTVLRDPEAPAMRALAWLHETPETVPYRVSVLTGSAAQAAEVATALAALPEVSGTRRLADFLPQDQEARLAIFATAQPALAQIAARQAVPVPPPGPDPATALARRLSGAGRPEALGLAATLDRLNAAPPETQAAAEAALFQFLPRLTETAALQAEAGPLTQADLPQGVTERFQTGATWRVEVTPAQDPRDQANLAAFVDALEARLSALGDTTLAGPPVHILRAGDTVAAAIAQAVAVAGLATLALCFLMLRDWRLVLAILIPLAAGAAFTAAASVLLQIPFNYANVIVLPLIIGLGVDSGIHLALRRRALRATGALFASNTPRAVFFSGLTTIAAFGSLSISDHQGTASMGLMLAVSVTLTLAATLIWTPALCDLLDRRSQGPNSR